MIDTEREGGEAETQAEGEAGCTQGARRGTRSGYPRIAPWAAGGAKPLSHRGCPHSDFHSLLLCTSMATSVMVWRDPAVNPNLTTK